jgi:regulator of sirC expression with transglutaminase-like and TPR domain
VVEHTLAAQFTDAITGRDEDVDLFGAAMLIARIGNDEVNPHPYAARLDFIAEEAAEHAGETRQVEALAAAIDYQLFSVLGFTGNTSDYANPANSYLDCVIDRRTGIPITLSLVYMEVAQRLGLRCEGVGYPGHFIVCCGEPEAPIYVDPFHQGARLDREELLAGLERRAPGSPNPEMFLLPITRRQLLQRMLNNLRMAYRNTGDEARWRTAVDLQLSLEPWNSTLVGERGMLNYRLGDEQGALGDLQSYVAANEREATYVGATRLLEHLRIRLRTDEETP